MKKLSIIVDENENSLPDQETYKGLLIELSKLYKPGEWNILTPASFKENISFDPYTLTKTERDDANLLVIWGVQSNHTNFSKEFLEEQYTLYEEAKKQNQYHQIINSLETKQTANKRNLYNIISNTKLPKLHEVNSLDALKELTDREESVIVKHEYGAEGDNLYMVKKASEVPDININEFLVQENYPHINELRLYLLGYNNPEIIGGRILSNRKLNNSTTNKGKFLKETYTPNAKEKEFAIETHKKLGLHYSSIDLFKHKEKDEFVLCEVNTICPNPISRKINGQDYVYNLSLPLAQYFKKLSEK